MRTAHRASTDALTLITITSDGQGTRVYFDGVSAPQAPHGGETPLRPRATMADCGSNFVLGSGATSAATWYGDLLGLAIYDRALEPDTVRRHYEAWRSGDLANGKGDDPESNPVSLYLFDEGSGNTVRDHGRGQRNLVIPRFFQIPIQPLLGWPRWTELRMRFVNWRDVTANIAGFAPLGFFLSAFLVASGFTSKSQVTTRTLAAGLGLSLLAEILQSFLPTRISNLTDVLANVIGTALGVLVFWLVESRLARTESLHR